MSAAAPAKRSAARLARIWAAAPANARGAAWLFIAAMAVTVMFVGVKLIDGELNAMQVTFLRAAAGALLLAPLYLRRDPMRLLRPKRPWAVLSRSVTATIAITLAYVSLSRLPLADAQALSFANTLFLVPIAAIFLGENVGVRRWSAAGAGFLGVLIMLRPTGAVNVGALAAVGGAFMMAITIAQVKALSRDHAANDVYYWGLSLMALLALPPALFVWRAPQAEHLLPLAMVVLGGALSQFCYVRAYSIAEAGAIAPVEYTRLVLAAIVGTLFFSEAPDGLAYAGAILIVMATLYITIREAQLGLKARAEETARSVR